LALVCGRGRRAATAQAGPAWPLRNPAVTAPTVGARTPAQPEDNLGALEVGFTAAHLARLAEVLRDRARLPARRARR
jgi:aryl-alcohol dehydrogenase-like predicted oxidoreductase